MYPNMNSYAHNSCGRRARSWEKWSRWIAPNNKSMFLLVFILNVQHSGCPKCLSLLPATAPPRWTLAFLLHTETHTYDVPHSVMWRVAQLITSAVLDRLHWSGGATVQWDLHSLVHYFSTPVPSERLFSIAGGVCGDNRTCLLLAENIEV